MSKYKYDFEESFDDDVSYQKFEKIKGKPPKKKYAKGHQTRKSEADALYDVMFEEYYKPEDEDFYPNFVQKQQPVEEDKKEEGPIPPVKQKIIHPKNTQEVKTFPAPSNTVHTIKSNQIDFSRLENMEKIENEYNGRKTYGIKFIFSSVKNQSRVVWFGVSFRERDYTFNTEFNFWKSISK